MVKKLLILTAFLAIILSCGESIIPDGPGSGVVDEDGNNYDTVLINGVEWMAENLKTTKLNDGTNIANITDSTEWDEASTAAYCWYENDISNKDISGALYNWYTVETDKLAPTGWHVATDAEWTALIEYMELIEGTEYVWTCLKSETRWASGREGEDTKGFKAVPGGSRGSGFSDGDSRAVWWSDTLGLDYPFGYSVHDYYTTANREEFPKLVGFSVRCVKD